MFGWSRRAWLLILTAIAVIAVIYISSAIILPFIMALVIAYIFTPSVLWLETKLRVPRFVGILGIYTIILGGAYLFIAMSAPRIAMEGRALARDLPKKLQAFEHETLPRWKAKFSSLSGSPAASTSASTSEASPVPSISAVPSASAPAIRITRRDDQTLDVDIGKGLELHALDDGGYVVRPVETKTGAAAKIGAYVERHYGELVKGGVQIVGGLARGIFLFFLTLMLAAYLMITHEAIFGFFRGLVRPSARDDFDSLMKRLDKGLSGVVRGQLLICLVNGVLTAIGFALLGVKYWPVLSLIAAFGSLIPIFGTILSSVPAIAVGLTDSFTMAMMVLGWIILIHQLEANFLNPKIIGTAAHLHPVLVVFVLLAGEHLFHAVGALLACPLLSIAQSLFLHFREVADREPPPKSDRRRG